MGSNWLMALACLYMPVGLYLAFVALPLHSLFGLRMSVELVLLELILPCLQTIGQDFVEFLQHNETGIVATGGIARGSHLGKGLDGHNVRMLQRRVPNGT